MKEGDAGFKQRKVSSCIFLSFESDQLTVNQKKKSKRSARRADGDDEEMAVDGEPTFERRRVEDGPQNLVDDDDLQAALSRARRETAKKRPKVRPEDLAAQSESSHLFPMPLKSDCRPVASQRQEDDAPQENGDEDGRITFDDTSEFVRNVTIESRAAPVKRERAASPATATQERPVVVKIEREEDGEVDEDEGMESEDEDEALAEMAAREGMSLAEYRLKIDAQMQEMEKVKEEGADVSDRLGQVDLGNLC